MKFNPKNGKSLALSGHQPRYNSATQQQHVKEQFAKRFGLEHAKGAVAVGTKLAGEPIDLSTLPRGTLLRAKTHLQVLDGAESATGLKVLSPVDHPVKNGLAKNTLVIYDGCENDDATSQNFISSGVTYNMIASFFCLAFERVG